MISNQQDLEFIESLSLGIMITCIIALCLFFFTQICTDFVGYTVTEYYGAVLFVSNLMNYG
jgi:hypothetical protein